MSAREIHLCGSIPLADAHEVFTTVADKLVGAVKRIPDGETGERLAWIRWQDHVFRDHPQFEAVESEGDYRNPTAFVGGRSIAHTIWWRIRDGVSHDALDMRPLGYAACAVESFRTFEALRMATADRFVTGYGIATECGFGRRPAETVGPLLDIHAALARV